MTSVPDLSELSTADLLALRDALEQKVSRRRWAAWKPYPWQTCPGEVPTLGMWLMLGGRGTGKTDGAARYVIEHVRGPACDTRAPGGHRIAIIAPTLGDAVESCVTGLSGLRTHDPKIVLRTGTGGTHVYFPESVKGAGRAVGKLFGAYTPEDEERLRAGGNRCLVWMEEMAAMRYLSEALIHTALGLRVGSRPHYVASTTPKPREEIRKLVKDPICLITHGKTRDAHHLPQGQRDMLLDRYEGTRLGKQELDGEVIDDVEGAYWTWAMIEDTRVKTRPELVRIVIAVDPNASDSQDADEFGIVAAGRGVDGDLYVLEDRSAHLTGEPACRRVWMLWHDLGGTGEVVYEGNKGGIWVGKALKDTFELMRKEGLLSGTYGVPPVHEVSASEDKKTRARPVSMLYELKRAHHVGVFEKLEKEQTEWVPESGMDSPNRLDAAVWAIIRLEQTGGQSAIATASKTGRRLPTLPGQPKFRGLGMPGMGKQR